jgi:hypothetical protein
MISAIEHLKSFVSSIICCRRRSASFCRTSKVRKSDENVNTSLSTVTHSGIALARFRAAIRAEVAVLCETDEEEINCTNWDNGTLRDPPLAMYDDINPTTPIAPA